MLFRSIVYYVYFGSEADGVESRMSGVQWAGFVALAAIMLLGIVNLFGVETLALAAAASLVG